MCLTIPQQWQQMWYLPLVQHLQQGLLNPLGVDPTRSDWTFDEDIWTGSTWRKWRREFLAQVCIYFHCSSNLLGTLVPCCTKSRKSTKFKRLNLARILIPLTFTVYHRTQQHQPPAAAITKYQQWQALWLLLMVDNHPCQCCDQQELLKESSTTHQKSLNDILKMPLLQQTVLLIHRCQIVTLNIGAWKIFI